MNIEILCHVVEHGENWQEALKRTELERKKAWALQHYEPEALYKREYAAEFDHALDATRYAKGPSYEHKKCPSSK